MNDGTRRQFESELSKLVIDLVWSATDGGCKLKESDFSHFEEPLHEWTELVNKFSTSIAQAEQEGYERGVESKPEINGIPVGESPEYKLGEQEMLKRMVGEIEGMMGITNNLSFGTKIIKELKGYQASYGIEDRALVGIADVVKDRVLYDLLSSLEINNKE